MTSKKDVSTTQDQMPDYIKQDTRRGNENVSNDDLQLPRIDLLQALSPQINKKKDSYIEGAEVGMLYNTLTGELYPDGLVICPVSFVKRYLVWVDRTKDSEGGLRGVFDSLIEAESYISDSEDESKLEAVATAEHFVLLENGDEVILSLAKSKMKVSRKFNSLVRLNGGDRFSRSYMLRSVEDKSPKGEFQNIGIESCGFPTKDIYLKAEALYEDINNGTKQASGDYQNTESESAY